MAWEHIKDYAFHFDKLTDGNATFEWHSDHQEAFDMVKDRLINPQILPIQVPQINLSWILMPQELQLELCCLNSKMVLRRLSAMKAMFLLQSNVNIV